MDKNCIYYTIFIAHTNPENWRVASLITEQDLSKVILLSPVWTAEDTRELMYISHPFYSCFNSLSGPFRNYACRSCLLKLINCILWKVQTAHWKCIIRFLPFWLLWNPSDIRSYAMKRALIFASKHLFLLYKTSILMKKWQQWVFINVMYYSTAFFILFSKNVSYFLPFVLYIFLLEWSCRANKAALFFTYSHFNLLFKNSFFHLSHFDSLSLQIIIKKIIF